MGATAAPLVGARTSHLPRMAMGNIETERLALALGGGSAVGGRTSSEKLGTDRKENIMKRLLTLAALIAFTDTATAQDAMSVVKSDALVWKEHAVFKELKLPR